MRESSIVGKINVRDARFLTFYETPIAAASIAQVHHAVLIDGHEVAIKVQYPDLELQMRLDTLTMSFLSRSVAWLFPEYRFEWAVSEFVMAISSELDFIQEAQNSERTAKIFKNKKMFKEYTTSKVLTMELCKGNKVDDVEFLKEIGVNLVKVAKSLIEVFAEMIFIHGFLHGDPHPGNILVSPEGPDGFSLVLLDHGIYRELDDEFRKNYCQLCQSALGRGMTAEEKKKLKTELKSLKMEDISSFMESLPPDFLAIMRTERAWGYPSSTDVEEPPTIDVLSEGDANTEVHATPEECSPNYAGPGSSVSEVLWQDSVDPDNMTYEELLDLGEAIGTQSRGLPLELINMLPTSRCVVCQMRYRLGERRTKLPCKHHYHSDCITRWLGINKVCPVCNAEVFGEETEELKPEWNECHECLAFLFRLWILSSISFCIACLSIIPFHL